MIEAVLHNYAFNLHYAMMLAGELPEEQMAQQPDGIANHPAWTLGHLAHASDFAAMLLGLPSTVPQEWVAACGRGTTPVPDRAKYPSRDELMAALEGQHARVAQALAAVDPDRLKGPNPNEDFRQIMPTLGDGLAYLLVAHEATHLGQLSAWRRSLGMPSVLG